MKAHEFERKIEHWGAEKLGRFTCEYGETFLAEKKVWDEDGLQWRMWIGYGADAENINDMGEIYHFSGTTRAERIKSGLNHAEVFLKHRDYFGDSRRR